MRAITACLLFWKTRIPDNPKITEIEIKGMPICSLLSEPNHEIKTLQMEKGDKILLYTDGVTEAFSREKNIEFAKRDLRASSVNWAYKTGRD